MHSTIFRPIIHIPHNRFDRLHVFTQAWIVYHFKQVARTNHLAPTERKRGKAREREHARKREERERQRERERERERERRERGRPGHKLLRSKQAWNRDI